MENGKLDTWIPKDEEMIGGALDDNVRKITPFSIDFKGGE